MNRLLNSLKPAGIVFWSVLMVACNVMQAPATKNTSAAANTHIGSFVWHDLISDNLDISKQFYGELFGWKFKNTTRPGGQEYTLIRMDGQYIGGMLQLDDPADGGDYSRWVGYLSVADINTALSVTEIAGGKTIVPAQTVSMIGEAAAIQDPEGAVLGLISTDMDIPIHQPGDAPGHIVWDELLASNPHQAAAFYQSLAGMTSSSVNRRGGEVLFLNSGGTKQAGIVSNPLDNTAPLWLTYFAVEDPLQISNKAASLGGKILLPPSADIREGTLALIADPTGAVLVLEKR